MSMVFRTKTMNLANKKRGLVGQSKITGHHGLTEKGVLYALMFICGEDNNKKLQRHNMTSRLKGSANTEGWGMFVSVDVCMVIFLIYNMYMHMYLPLLLYHTC